MIRHAALFRLAHPAGSLQETSFLTALARLENIPGVTAFQIAREISPKNDFHFAVAMEFADQAAFAAYDQHPDHAAFVQTRWIPEVTAFMEHDTTPL